MVPNTFVLLALVASDFVAAAPLSSSTNVASSLLTSINVSPTIVPASDNANAALWGPDANIHPEPIRGQLGASILGPQNVPVELQNPDLLAPPTTDEGDVKNAKW